MSDDWRYDEFRQLAVDFDDEEQVRVFEAKHPSDPAAAREVLERIGVGKGTVLVDMGCATGWFTVEAARLGAVAYGVDTSARMVEFAKTKARAAGVDAEFHQAGNSCGRVAISTIATTPSHSTRPTTRRPSPGGWSSRRSGVGIRRPRCSATSATSTRPTRGSSKACSSGPDSTSSAGSSCPAACRPSISAGFVARRGIWRDLELC
jgi:hypothetical protein